MSIVLYLQLFSVRVRFKFFFKYKNSKKVSSEGKKNEMAVT